MVCTVTTRSLVRPCARTNARKQRARCHNVPPPRHRRCGCRQSPRRCSVSGFGAH
jgi:hypothetical protein